MQTATEGTFVADAADTGNLSLYREKKGVTPSTPNMAVVGKEYVLDYVSAFVNVIMESESGAGGLSYRYVYANERFS